MKKLNYWEAKRKIEVLVKLAESNAPPAKHLPMIKAVFNGVRMPAITLNNNVMYRSRWNKGTALYSNARDLRYPDAKYVKKKGRLNDVNESVLYAAACELGTIIESRPDMNKLFTIAIIRPLDPEMLYFPLGVTDKGCYSRKIKKAEEIVINYVNKEITRSVNTRDNYNSTIALAWFFLRTNIAGPMNYGCVVYPSVESSKISNKTTYNIAILPDVFDRYFEISGAKAYCLTNEDEHYQLNDLNEVLNIDEGGVLEWRYTNEEMIERVSQGLALDGTYCENIKGLAEEKAEQGAQLGRS